MNLILLLTSVGRAFPRAELDYPEAELATFKVADGFEVNLFASELDGVIKPIQMRFDLRGRLWVIGSTVYPQLEPGQVPNDKVLILEDRDGDGRCDHTSVFADGLMIPTGIELTKDGAYIGHGRNCFICAIPTATAKPMRGKLCFADSAPATIIRTSIPSSGDLAESFG